MFQKDLRPLRHLIFTIVVMNADFLTTEQLLALLKQNPLRETECRMILPHRIGSTHYWYWDADARCFMHTRDWPFSPMDEREVMQWYGDCRWRIDQ